MTHPAKRADDWQAHTGITHGCIRITGAELPAGPARDDFEAQVEAAFKSLNHSLVFKALHQAMNRTNRACAIKPLETLSARTLGTLQNRLPSAGPAMATNPNWQAGFEKGSVIFGSNGRPVCTSAGEIEQVQLGFLSPEEQRQLVEDTRKYCPDGGLVRYGEGSGSYAEIRYSVREVRAFNRLCLRAGNHGKRASFLPDEILFHELVHCLRFMSGHDNKNATGGALRGYGNQEEFYGVVLTNVYSSEWGRPLRANHSLSATATTQSATELLANEEAQDLLVLFCDQHRQLTNELAALHAPFNPFALIYSDPKKYHFMR